MCCLPHPTLTPSRASGPALANTQAARRTPARRPPAARGTGAAPARCDAQVPLRYCPAVCHPPHAAAWRTPFLKQRLPCNGAPQEFEPSHALSRQARTVSAARREAKGRKLKARQQARFFKVGLGSWVQQAPFFKVGLGRSLGCGLGSWVLGPAGGFHGLCIQGCRLPLRRLQGRFSL